MKDESTNRAMFFKDLILVLNKHITCDTNHSNRADGGEGDLESGHQK